MASGNLGDLWFNLGVKNNVSKTLNSMLKEVQSFEGVITAINKRIVDLNNTAATSSGKAKADAKADAKALKVALNNALDYLNMLQRIEREERKVSSLKELNPNVNTAQLDKASKLLKDFKGQLLDLQKGREFGGVDAAYLSAFGKNMRNTLGDVRDLMKAFQNENGLTNAASNAARLENELQRVRNRLSEISGLQSEAYRKGYNSTMLMGGRNPLQGVQRRINSMLKDDGLLNDETKYKQLISDIQLAFTKATGAIQEYSRAKTKTIEASRKQAQAEKDATRAADEKKAALARLERQENALGERIKSLTSLQSKLESKRTDAIKIGADTTGADKAIAQIRNLIEALESLKSQVSGRTTPFGDRAMRVGTGQEVTELRAVVGEQERINREQAKFNQEKHRAIELERKHQQEVSTTAAKVRNDLARAMEQVGEKANQMHGVFQDLKSLFLQGGLVFGLQQFTNSIIQTGGEIEQQHIALRSILGDVSAADQMFAQTQQLALESPFKFGELNRDVKQLAAYGVKANNLYDTTKRLADIASGLGVSFERLGLAYGQVKARAWLDGKELRQFAYAGLPMLQKITDLYNAEGRNGRTNYTTGDVKKMISAREVSFEDVQKVLWQLTDEGGQFYNMQLVLSQTLLGRWNKLIDAWDIMLGKFADGKSIVGSVFKGAIDQVTNLVLAMDKLSPSLIGLGAAYVGKKVLGGAMGSAGLSARLSALRSAQTIELRSYALEQQQLVLEGKITQQIATQNITKRGYMLAETASTQNAMSRLAIEGKLSLLQIQKAFREKLIAPELVKQLEVMGLISAKQSELIMKEGRLARARLAGQQAMGKFSGIFTWGNAAMAGIGIALGGIMKYQHEQAEIEQRAKDITASAEQHIKTYQDALTSLASVNLSVPQQIDKANEELKEVLVQSGRYTDSIKEQVEGATNLVAQYKILKKAVEDAKNASIVEETFAGIISEAFSKSGGWSFGVSGPNVGGTPSLSYTEDFATNAADMKEALTGIETALTGLSEKTKTAMDKVANSFLPAEMASLSLEEKLVELHNRGDYSAFVEQVSNGNRDIEATLKNMESDIAKYSRNLKVIMTENVPKMLDIIGGALGKSGDELAKWAKSNVSKVDAMFKKLIQLCNVGSPQIVKKINEILYASLNLRDPNTPSGNVKKPWRTGLKVGGAGEFAYNVMQRSGVIGGTLGGKTKFYQKEMASLLRGIDALDFETFGENVRKQYKTVRNENDARKSAGAKFINQRKQAMLEAIAAANGISLDLGKNSVTGNFGKDKSNRSDEELKLWRERLDAAKKFYSTYKKYKDVWGPEKALEQTRMLFPNVADMNVNDYEGSLQHIIDTLGEDWFAKSPERKKFLTSIKEAILDYDLSEVGKRKAEELTAAFNDALEQGTSQFNLYKSLLEKTGNKTFASQAFKNGAIWNDNARALAAEFKERTGMDVDLDATDAQAKHYLENIDGAYELWQKIVGLVKGDYTNYLENAADVIQNTMSTVEKINKVNSSYGVKIDKAKAQGDNDLVDRLEYQKKQELSSLYLEALKRDINWEGFFSGMKNLTKTELVSLRKKIIDYIKKGGLDNMAPTDKKTVFDGLDKLTEVISGGVFTGWQDTYKMLSDAEKELVQAQKTLKNVENKYGKDSIQAESAKIAVNNAQGRVNDAGGRVDAKWNKALEATASIGNIITQLGSADGSGHTTLSNLGGWYTTIANMFTSDEKQMTKNSKVGSIIGMFAGLTEVIAEKGFGKFIEDGVNDAQKATGSVIDSIFGTELSKSQATKDYEEAKEEYEQLATVWDSLIEKKTEYLSLHWGTEAQAAAAESAALLEKEVEGQRELARMRLAAGGSAGAHTYGVRMWTSNRKDSRVDESGKAFGDYASVISQQLGVPFNKMEDMTKMSAEQLQWIKENYTVLWAKMDDEFREYLESIISAEDQLNDLIDDANEKLFGWKFDSLVSSWGSAMATMGNYSDKLFEDFEDGLKKAIINSMIENLYTDEINKLLEKSKKYGENADKVLGQNGKTISEYTREEYEDMMSDADKLADRISNTRDFLRDLYDWSDDSSSSSSTSIKSITEETADLLASYINAIRADVSVNRANLQVIMQSVASLPDLNAIAQSQLAQLTQLVVLAQTRNGRLDEMYDWMRAVTNGTKKINVA